MIGKFSFFLIATFSLVLFSSCKNEMEYKSIPAQTEAGVMAVIEIPAGTNRKIEYNQDLARFEIDVKDGKERIIDFLPYPGNYGFIPSTHMDPARGGDGDALDPVLHLYDASTGVTTNLGFSAHQLYMVGNLLSFEVRESAHGNTDLNGDGEIGAHDFA